MSKYANTTTLLQIFEHSGETFGLLLMNSEESEHTQVILAHGSNTDSGFTPNYQKSVFYDLAPMDFELSRPQLWGMKMDAKFNDWLATQGDVDPGDPVDFLTSLAEFLRDRIRYQNGKLVMV